MSVPHSWLNDSTAFCSLTQSYDPDSTWSFQDVRAVRILREIPAISDV
jgi:hypothetical protein